MTQSNNRILLSSGTGSTAQTIVTSYRRACHTSDTSSKLRMVGKFGDTGSSGNTRKFGLAYGTAFGGATASITNGAYFQLAGPTFSVCTMATSIGATVLNGDFNGIYGNTINLDTSTHEWEIYYTDQHAYFMLDGKNLHTVVSPDLPWTDTSNFYMWMSNQNTGGTVSTSLHMRSANISRLGSLVTQPNSVYIAGATAAWILKRSAGNLHSVIIGSAGSVTLYDNNSAASGATVTSLTVVTNNIGNFDFNDLPFFNGLTLVTTGTPQATIVWE